MVYFLVQSVASLVLLVGLSSFRVYVCTFSFLLKFGMFPFMFWYVSSVYSFGAFCFFLVLTFQKLPLLIFFVVFGRGLGFLDFYLVLLLSVVRGMVGGFSILNCSDLRMLLIFSSFSGSSWLLFSFTNSLLTFLF